ncbi:hypothetical protein BBJ28_00008563 [Nothophytophthora sp. Chile5]|nr:hypothetical protein BBJ28_00008563 [Nothophytophthora sp. Chile5]
MTPCACSCGLHDVMHRPAAATRSAAGPSSASHVAGFERQEEDEPSAEELHDNGDHDNGDHDAALATLQLQVRALQRYKANYELLCGQLDELNAQIGLQLQRHEADVAALQASVAELQADKLALEFRASETQQALVAQHEASRQDREYSEHVHRQLSTAAELLRATEKRMEGDEAQRTAEIQRLQAQLAASNDDQIEQQVLAKELKEELDALRKREASTKEQEALRRQREKRKHKKELLTRTAKLRVASDELDTQRAASRLAKKQLTQLQADNEALRKQLANVKRDGAHLSDIIDSQRAERTSHVEQLSRAKRAKKQLSQDVNELEDELADAKEELVNRNSELETCRAELKAVRGELRVRSQALEDSQRVNAKLTRQVEALQQADEQRCSKAEEQQQQQRANRERRSHKELLRLRELLAANQQRASESSRDVQKLKRELLGVQKLLHGCAQDQETALQPMDQWAEVVRNSAKVEESVLQSAIMDQVRAFAA